MTTDITKLATEDQIGAALERPALLDRLGSSDLKRVGKKLCALTIELGNRSIRAERKVNDLELINELLHQRIHELTGSKPPQWSYLHKDEALRLHVFSGFSTITADTGCIVCGEEEGVLHPIYEFDFEDLGKTPAEEAAQAMLVHLRQSFIPRPKETIA